MSINAKESVNKFIMDHWMHRFPMCRDGSLPDRIKIHEHNLQDHPTMRSLKTCFITLGVYCGDELKLEYQWVLNLPADAVESYHKKSDVRKLIYSVLETLILCEETPKGFVDSYMETDNERYKAHLKHITEEDYEHLQKKIEDHAASQREEGESKMPEETGALADLEG